MKKGLSLTFVVMMSLAVLLTGCGNSEQVESNSGSSSAVQMEDTSSSEAESSSEPETSEPNIMPAEPEESDSSTAPESGDAENGQVEEENSEMQMNVQVGGSTFTATLEENEAVDALVEMMEQGPVTIQMSDYSGFEKVILSRLVDTFISRISLTMPPAPKSHNTAYVLPWEEPLHWQSRSSGYSSS